MSASFVHEDDSLYFIAHHEDLNDCALEERHAPVESLQPEDICSYHGLLAVSRLYNPVLKGMINVPTRQPPVGRA
jgi:hypothetical protein